MSDNQKYFIIRFIAEDSFISSAIRWVTFSEFSHTEIMTETGTWIGAHDKGGVQERAANYCKPSFERRYAIPVNDMTLALILDYARSKIGTPYNFKDILGLLIHRNMSQPKAVICSMFVYMAALAGGIQMLNVLPDYANRVTPDTLHLSPLLIGRMVRNA